MNREGTWPVVATVVTVLATALWGSFLVVVMVARFVVLRIRAGPNPDS